MTRFAYEQPYSVKQRRKRSAIMRKRAVAIFFLALGALILTICCYSQSTYLGSTASISNASVFSSRIALLLDTVLRENSAEKPTMPIELVRAELSQEPIVANLLQFYVHDFSEFCDLDLGADGRFEYKDLPLYFRESSRHPFLARKDGKWVGLIFVRRGSQVSGDENVWDMAEFFVVRGCRRRGVGTEIARQIWRQFPGKWEVRVMETNDSAHHFWERAIAQYAGERIASVRINKDGDCWRVFSFDLFDSPGVTLHR